MMRPIEEASMALVYVQCPVVYAGMLFLVLAFWIISSFLSLCVIKGGFWFMKERVGGY